MKTFALLSFAVFTGALCAAVAHAIEPRTLLLVDDDEIVYRSGTQRTLHQPKRHGTEPLLTGPAIKNQFGYCTVRRDPATGRYQLWYQMTGQDCVVCYAESTDGLVWIKPDLDLITLKGIPERNIVLNSAGQYGASVVVDPPGGDAERRYKLAYWSIPPLQGVPVNPKDPRGFDGGLYVACSPDGIHWTKEPGPTIRGSYGRGGDPPLVGDPSFRGQMNSVSDVLDAMYDPLRKKYVVYSKAWIDGPDGKTFWKRAIARTESADFLHWSPAQLMMAPDEHDGIRPAAYPGTRQGVQLHGAPVFIRHGIYFALMQVADFETNGLQPIELAISHDGLKWARPFRDTPFLPVGESGTFDAGRIWSNGTPVILEDEIRIYYGACESPWQFGKAEYPWGSKKKLPKTGLGLATLPLDRFAGVRPIEKIGQITLRPRSLAGAAGLTLNADASAGTIRVEILNAAGYRLPGYTKADAVPIFGDGFHHNVAWQNADLSKLPPGDVTIRIHLENAEVFAVTIE